MSDDTWSMLVVSCVEESLEIVSDALWQRGVVAVEERPSSDGRVCELWTSVGGDPEAIVHELVDCEGVLGVRIEKVSRAVADSWRKFASPIEVTAEERIVPSWLDVPARRGDILIDPFDTFGLGNHPTTIGALRLLLRTGISDARLLDVGTGSGVLAIAMAKCRTCRCTAFDISPSSRGVVGHNAELNGVHIDVVDGFDDVHDTYDVVVANILAPVLRELAPRMVERVERDGVLVLAGMRSDQIEDVVTEFEGYSIGDSVEIDGWKSVVLRR